MTQHEALLIGNVPFETPLEVFERYGVPLGRFLVAMPDGEVNRPWWVSRLHYQVFAAHPQLKILRHPKLEDGRERVNPRDTSDSWQFAREEGATEILFGEPGRRLGYARDAIANYFIFKTLKEKGVLPEGLRFQVPMPSAHSAVPTRVVPDAGDRAALRKGYEEALIAEINFIARKIPHGDLAFQFDAATEVQDVYEGNDTGSAEEAMDLCSSQLARLVSAVPKDVAVGIHYCFGTLGGWPRFDPADLGPLIEFVNLTMAKSSRPLSWVHVPALPRTDDAFYVPLKDLNPPKETEVFLGLVHNMESFPERLSIARKYRKEFGLAAYCGLGRFPDQLDSILQDHLQALRIARETRAGV